MIESKLDFSKIMERYDALWECEIIDRAPVYITYPKENKRELPKKQHISYEERWLDSEYRAELEATKIENRVFYADAIPTVIPNIGPELYSAWCGCGYNYGESTTWSTPCIEDWAKDYDKAVLDMEHPLLKKTMEYTKALLERGKGKYIVGVTDYHVGGDHLAALRDPANLAMDLIENKAYVVDKLRQTEEEFFRVYDYFNGFLKDAGQLSTGWLPLFSEGKYHIPSNDFSCMISKAMFDEMFLPGIVNECKHMDRNIYHLDGPGALRHLDSLLDVKEIGAIQWVPGAGNDAYHRWVDVYQKIQRKKKAIALYINVSELPMVFDTLKPEGVWFAAIRGIKDEAMAEAVVKRIAKWC